MQVFDRDKLLKVTLNLGQPLVATCFLNEEGDLLAAWGKRLVIIKASEYAFTAPVSGRGHGQHPPTIFDYSIGKTATPAVWSRALSSKLQGLCSSAVPWDR